MNQDRRGECESGESEPHFSGLPTEGSHSEMASGPLTRPRQSCFYSSAV